MSLYAHLSSIEAVVGQEVARGQTLGQTGATGLAGGDHLHFTMLLHGLPVNPNEWWDAHWIDNRLVRKLGAALPFTPSGQEGPEEGQPRRERRRPDPPRRKRPRSAARERRATKQRTASGACGPTSLALSSHSGRCERGVFRGRRSTSH